MSSVDWTFRAEDAGALGPGEKLREKDVLQQESLTAALSDEETTEHLRSKGIFPQSVKRGSFSTVNVRDEMETLKLGTFGIHLYHLSY
ncbi:hypothetical protein MHYP_G00299910 [Metynnis hypsauchen]